MPGVEAERGPPRWTRRRRAQTSAQAACSMEAAAGRWCSCVRSPESHVLRIGFDRFLLKSIAWYKFDQNAPLIGGARLSASSCFGRRPTTSSTPARSLPTRNFKQNTHARVPSGSNGDGRIGSAGRPISRFSHFLSPISIKREPYQANKHSQAAPNWDVCFFLVLCAVMLGRLAIQSPGSARHTCPNPSGLD